jgi:transaldolase / glucose-6-phosphate isomerase
MDLAAQRRFGEIVARRVHEARRDLLPRLFAKDPTLWVSGERERREVVDRLGWLDLPVSMVAQLDAVARFVAEVRAAGFERVVLMGMGGSSLAPDVFARMLGTAPGAPALTVLDTTDPAAVLAAEAGGDLARTLFVVSSKSGGTVEPNAMAAYFLERTGGNGAQFVAITDPGSSLAALGAARGFRHVFLNPPDVGGRYSALSLFGLVPAALIGADVRVLLDGAARARAECVGGDGAAAQRVARLAAIMATGVEHGRDRLTFLMPEMYEPFGSWAEQLVAESTGKGGTGVLPVVGEARRAPAAYGSDRLFVGIWSPAAGGADDVALAAVAKAGHPALALPFDPATGLGAAFFEWEVATALAGVWLRVNPFDQPNVAESKANTDAVLARLARGEQPAAGEVGVGGLAARVAGWLAGIRAGDYVAVLAYFAPTPAYDAFLRRLGAAVGRATRAPVTTGYGPRFLHSTGQLHKGGPATGAFLQIETEDERDVPVPGAGYTFGRLKLAQALGDLEALTTRGRNVLRVRVAPGDLPALEAALAAAAPQEP